jgi:hypothetical protein
MDVSKARPWSDCMSASHLAVRDQRSTGREFLRCRPGGVALRADARAPILAADAVIATVKKAGAAGAPLEPIYATLQERIGCTYPQFEALISTLEGLGCIRRAAEFAFHIQPPEMAASGTTPSRAARASSAKSR